MRRITSITSMLQTRSLSTAPPNIKLLIKSSTNAVCFDVDSTVIVEEAIDSFANYLNVGDKVAELTKKAMGGDVAFEEALNSRLKIMNPDIQTLNNYLESHTPQLSTGIKHIIDSLQARGTHVYLISGGFRQMIYPIADELNIPRNRVIANNLMFKEDGSFEDFDRTEPTSKHGGKAVAIQQLKDWYGYSTVVMIGDGATDLDSRPAADAVIGFGGVVVREIVKQQADWFITSFEELQKTLDEEIQT